MKRKKVKTRGLNIQAKIMIPAVIVVVLLAALIGMNSYLQLKDSLSSMGVEMAKMSTDMAMASIDASLIPDKLVDLAKLSATAVRFFNEKPVAGFSSL